VSLGREVKSKRYETVTATVRGGRQAAQREAARLVKLASEGRISTERETLGGLPERWLNDVEARARRLGTLALFRWVSAWRSQRTPASR
jgi:hypothetical protein